MWNSGAVVEAIGVAMAAHIIRPNRNVWLKWITRAIYTWDLLRVGVRAICDRTGWKELGRRSADIGEMGAIREGSGREEEIRRAASQFLRKRPPRNYRQLLREVACLRKGRAYQALVADPAIGNPAIFPREENCGCYESERAILKCSIERCQNVGEISVAGLERYCPARRTGKYA